MKYYAYAKSDKKRVAREKPKRVGRKNSEDDSKIKTPVWLWEKEEETKK